MRVELSAPVTERPMARREQLLSAAALLFRRRGYHAVSVDTIGAAVGLSGPAVYRHFPGKQALLCEVIRSYVSAVNVERDHRNARDRGGEHILDAAVAVGMRLPDRLVTFHRETNSLEEPALAGIEPLRKSIAAGWDAFLAAHGVSRDSETASLRLQALHGVQLHLSLTRAGSKALRTRLSERLMTAVLDAPVPRVSPVVKPVCTEPIQHVTTREALLDAATMLFEEQGFSRVSLRDIGAVVGLSASAVSRHFESKDQLMAVIFDRATAQISASIAAALRASSTGEAAAREILRRYVVLAIDFRDLISIISTQLYSLAEPQRVVRVGNRRMYIDELTHALQLARPELSAVECRLRSGAAYSAVNEVAMHPTLTRRDGVADALTTLSQQILLA